MLIPGVNLERESVPKYKAKTWGWRAKGRAEDKRGSERDWVKESDRSLGSSPGREVPVRAWCPRQAPGACYSKRHAPHTAQHWDGFTIFLTGHDISLGLAAEETVWRPPADILLGNTSGPTEGWRLFPQNWKKFANRFWCKRAESSWR